MHDNLNLEIVSPQGIIFQGDVTSVSLPTFNGTITVLPHHVPLFTKLAEGEIEIKSKDKVTSIVISGGFLEVDKNSARVLSDYAIRADSIQQAHAEERKRMAEEKLKQKLDNKDFTIADKDLKLSILELKVAEKVRRKQRS
jgi:F-type H+-transporting ATPase subunit epsilon